MTKFVKNSFANKTSLLKKIKIFLKHRDPLRYARYRYEWNNAPKKNKIRDFPIHLGLEPTNACNLKCVFCARNNINYKVGFMNFNLYKKIIDESAKNKLKSIKLVRGGESLLHPQFAEMIKYAREKGIIDIIFNTNATLLTPEKSLEIIKAKPDFVIFSVDAPEKKIYEQQRVGANFEQVELNIKNFVELKSKIYPKIITRAHMVYTEETENLINKHITRWKGITDEVTANKANKYCEKPANKKFICRTPFRRLDITWDGSVYLCDPDFDPAGRLLLGNVNTETLYEIWHSEKLNRIREIFRQGSPHLIDPCKYCQGV